MAKIIWADPAIQDLEVIVDYVRLENPTAARRLVERAFAAVELLQRFPRMGSHPTELRGLPYRQLIVSPCRISYRLERKAVYIVHIFRGEQLVRRELFPSLPRELKSLNKQGPADRKRRDK